MKIVNLFDHAANPNQSQNDTLYPESIYEDVIDYLPRAIRQTEAARTPADPASEDAQPAEDSSEQAGQRDGARGESAGTLQDSMPAI